jgi:hypothetical protein
MSAEKPLPVETYSLLESTMIIVPIGKHACFISETIQRIGSYGEVWIVSASHSAQTELCRSLQQRSTLQRCIFVYINGVVPN